MNLTTIAHFVLLFVFIAALSYRDCGSKIGRIECITLTGCIDDNAETCVVNPDSVLNISADFLMCANVSEAYLNATLYIFESSIKLRLNKPNLCTDFQFSCPLIEGEVYSAEYTFPIKVRPKVPLAGHIKLEAFDERNNTILCVEVDGKLDPKPSAGSPTDLQKKFWRI